MKFTDEMIRDAISEIDCGDRHGNEYNWPACHSFGKFERACDRFLFQLKQLPPFTWANAMVAWLSANFNR